MNIYDERGFDQKEWAILEVLFKSAAPLTIHEVTNKCKENLKVKMAWETCEKKLNVLVDENFVKSQETLNKKQIRYLLDHERKKQLKEKYDKIDALNKK